MVPDFLSSKYVQYKEDTNKFITWLVDTAKHYGYVKPSPVPIPKTATPRLKGRARKDAQKAAAIASKETEVKGKVSLQDIIHLAKTIVASTSSKNPVHVPPFVLSWARKAIDARRQFVAWFQKQAVDQPAIEDDNERHVHFIQVLEDALNILTPYVTASLKENAVPVQPISGKAVEAHGKTPSNLFEVLDDSQDHDLLGSAMVDVPQGVAPEDATQTKKKELYELESSEADMQFAVFCIFQDAHCVQGFLIETWKEYKSGEIDLVTASATTNTAINFIHGAEEQMMASYPQLTGYSKILDVFHPFAKKAEPESEHGLNSRDARHMSMASDHGSTGKNHVIDPEYLYARTFRVLEAFRHRVQATSYDHNPPRDEPGWLAYESLIESIPSEKDMEGLCTLMDMLPEFSLFNSLVVMPAEDEVSQGMREVQTGDGIALWTVFAYQIYLEIHRTLGGQVGRGLEELQVAKTQVKATLKNYFWNEQSMLNDGWPEYNAHMLQQLNDEILEEFLEEDPFLTLDARMTKAMYCLSIRFRPDEPFRLLSQHPLLCGTLLQNIRLRIEAVGIPMVNGWGSILCGAHLYNAARQEGYLLNDWADMEALIAIHSPELIFVGKAPSSPNQYSKHFKLARGMSVTAFLRGPRRSKQLWSKSGSRQIERKTHLSGIFRNTHHVTEYLEIDAQTVSQALAQVAQKSKRSRAATSLLNHWNQTHKLTQVQLLAIVRQTLANEQPMLHFDYVAMHHRCLLLFAQTRHDLGTALEGVNDFDTSEMSLPLVLGRILSQANEMDLAPLEKASAILKDVVGREGDVEMKKMNLKGKRHEWLKKGI